MPLFNLDMEYDDSAVVLAFQRMQQAGRNLKTPLADIGESMLISTDDRFVNQEDPDGVAWKDLKDETWKRKKNDKILTESQRLRGSFNYNAGDDELQWGSNVIYAAIHQLGGETKPGITIDARPSIGLSDDDRSEITDIMRDHLRRAVFP